MVLGALVIGLLTAYYFGLEVGIGAAVASALLFLLAAVVPGATILVYGVVAALIVAVCWLGPRRGKKNNEVRDALRRGVRRAAQTLWRRL